MRTHNVTRILGALGIAAVSGAASAGSATNTLTSIATVTDSCDIVAVGLDFGITHMPIPAGGITTTTPNTSVGNALSGNSVHPDAADDGGAGNDDELSLSLPDAVTSGLISTALGLVSTASAGVYVACTTTPSSITVTSSAAGATPYSLPVTLGASPSGSFAGKMAGIGGGATSGNELSYTMSFVGVPASTAIGGGLPLNLFTGAYVATGTVPATQSGTVVPGYYADVATATVNF